MKFAIDLDNNMITPSFSMDEDSEPMELAPIETTVFINKFFNQNIPKIGLLPPAVRWISPDRRVVVFERPPAKHYLELAADRKENAATAIKTSFEIPIPWTVYVGYYDYDYNPVHLRIYSRRAPLESMDDKLSLLPLPNIYMDSSLCNPIVSVFEDHDRTIAYGVSEAYNMLWNSGSNMDLLHACAQAQAMHVPVRVPSGDARGFMNYVNYFNAWAKLSVPEVLKVKFPDPSLHMNDWVPNENGTTLAQAIELTRSYVLGASNMSRGEELLVRLVNCFT